MYVIHQMEVIHVMRMRDEVGFLLEVMGLDLVLQQFFYNDHQRRLFTLTEVKFHG